MAKIVGRTEGYSGSDMRNLIQEACQGPVRKAMGCAAQLSDLAQLSEADVSPVVLKDFQVMGLPPLPDTLRLLHYMLDAHPLHVLL